MHPKSKRGLAMILVFVLVFSGSIMGFAEGKDYTTHWAASTIEKWIHDGMIKGYSDGSFKPDNNITRAEFMSLVNGAFGYKEKATISYSDVKMNDWFADPVAKAKAAGYIGGYPDGTMKPNKPISREEAAAIIQKLQQLPSNEEAANKFTDKAALSWSKGAVGVVASAGIMGGYPDGSFKPQSFMKRAEAVVALNKVLAYVAPKDVMTIYDKAGTYGPADGVKEIYGDVEITSPNVTLQNMIIHGNLTIAASVGDGEVYLKGITVKGDTIVQGGGENSIHFENTILVHVIVNKADGKIRIAASGSTVVQQVTLESGAKLEEANATGKGFEAVNIEKSLPEAAKVTLLGSFETVEVKATAIAIEIPKGTINNLKVDAAAAKTKIDVAAEAKIVEAIIHAVIEVIGKGTITEANINVSGVTFEKAPEKIETAPGVEAPKVTTPATTPSTGGGGGGGGGNSTIAVSGISVTGEADATTITTNNGTLQMLAAIEPTNATNKNVTWSVINGTSEATISAGGLLTAVRNGTVTVKAIAKDGSGKFATKEIVISGQIPVISTISTIANGAVDPTVVITLTKDTFTAEANLSANWTGSLGTTGLSGGSITRNSHTQITFQLNGTAEAGVLTLQANGEALTSGVASNTITITVPEATQTVEISEITSASMDMRKGSIIMGYTFKNNMDIITYADAVSDTYALDTENSTVALLKNGSQIGNSVKFSELTFVAPDEGESTKVSFTDFNELLSKFALSFGNPLNPANIPDEVKVVIKSKTTVDGKTIHNPWGPIEFSELVTSDLYMDWGIDTDKSSVAITPGNKTAGQPFSVAITLKDANENLINGDYGVEILDGTDTVGGGQITFTNGQASVDAILADAGNYMLVVKVNNTVISSVEVVVVSSPILDEIRTSMDGSEIYLTFHKEMANPTGKHNQFTVMVNGTPNPVTTVALKEGNSLTIVLTLTNALAGGEAITIAYTQGNVTAADGGILCTFVPQPVTHGVAPGTLYGITVASVVGGTATVTTNPVTEAQADETVTVTIADVEAGKQFKSITVAEEGGAVATTEVVAGTSYTFTMPAKAITITIEVEPKTYTVAFNSNGGSNVASIEGVEHGARVTLPLSPTKEDFIFRGWFKDNETFGNEFTEGTQVISDTTVYAKWEEAKSVAFHNTISSINRISFVLFEIFVENPEEEPEPKTIPELTVTDFTLIKDFGTENAVTIEGISFSDNEGYSILPPESETFEAGAYTLIFGKAGYKVAELPVIITDPSIVGVSATNGRVTIILEGTILDALTAENFQAQVRIDFGEPEVLTLTNFQRNDATVTFDFAPIVPTSTEQNVIVTVKLGAGEFFEAEEPFMVLAAPVVPEGDLLDADAGFDFTGVLYTRDSNIYYNQVDATGTWVNEALIGTGTEGRMAIDSTGNPHVVYTTSGKIGYRMHDGSEWTEEVLIESNYGGACSKADIAVDGNGKAHITYTDTMGNTGDYTDHPDIMYANNITGSFEKSIVYKGYLDYYGGADRYAEYFNKGSYITVDLSGNYSIIAHKYQYQTWMNGNDKQYSVTVDSNLGNGGTTISSSDVFDIYDLTSKNSKVIALYNHSGFKTAELAEGAGTISFTNTTDITGTSVSSVATDGTNVVVGGINATKLQAHYNGIAQDYNDIVVKNTTKVSVVNVGGSFYAVYTDNSDSKIKMQEIQTP